MFNSVLRSIGRGEPWYCNQEQACKNHFRMVKIKLWASLDGCCRLEACNPDIGGKRKMKSKHFATLVSYAHWKYYFWVSLLKWSHFTSTGVVSLCSEREGAWARIWTCVIVTYCNEQTQSNFNKILPQLPIHDKKIKPSYSSLYVKGRKENKSQEILISKRCDIPRKKERRCLKPVRLSLSLWANTEREPLVPPCVLTLWSLLVADPWQIQIPQRTRQNSGSSQGFGLLAFRKITKQSCL